jgi:hypothetical protein
MTEPLLPPRSPNFRRTAATFAAATLFGLLGFGAAASFAAQAENAAPSTTPDASASAASAVSAPAIHPATPVARLPAPAAAIDHGGPRWAELSESQRKVLAPLANDWNEGIDSRGKERWLDVAARFPTMHATEQQRANQRMVEWAHMTVAQRTRARENFEESRSVSKEEREARWKAYQALPEEKKRELAKRAAAAAAPASAASASGAVLRRHAPAPLTAIRPKKPAAAASGHAPAGSAPVSVAAHPGATTPLINRHIGAPGHGRDGQARVASGATAVDRTTLLPRRTVGTAASAIPPAHP